MKISTLIFCTVLFALNISAGRARVNAALQEEGDGNSECPCNGNSMLNHQGDGGDGGDGGGDGSNVQGDDTKQEDDA